MDRSRSVTILVISRSYSPSGSGAPFTPGARIEACIGKTGMGHGQQIVTGRYPRSAIKYSRARGLLCEDRSPLRLQLIGGQKPSLEVQIALPKVIDRPRDMASDRVNGLLLASIAGRIAGVDEERRLGNLIDSDDPIGSGLAAKDRGGRVLFARARRYPGLKPCRPAATQHRHSLMPHIAQQPPQPRAY